MFLSSSGRYFLRDFYPGKNCKLHQFFTFTTVKCKSTNVKMQSASVGESCDVVV